MQYIASKLFVELLTDSHLPWLTSENTKGFIEMVCCLTFTISEMQTNVKEEQVRIVTIAISRSSIPTSQDQVYQARFR